MLLEQILPLILITILCVSLTKIHKTATKVKIAIVSIASGVTNGISGSVVISTFNDTATNDQTLTYSPASKSFSIFFHNVNQGSGNDMR